MLPLENPWYRKLLIFALGLGFAGGVAAVLFMGITGAGIGFFFGDGSSDWWSGQWWWIPLTALGGLAVAALRKAWKIPEQVPGAIPLAQQAWVEPSTALYWVAVSAISLISGASLGPSFSLVVMGGALGSWLVNRLGKKDDAEAKAEYALTGMAAGMGAAFSAPLFAAILTGELSPTAKRNYVAAFIPEIIAATIGFVVFFGVTGSSMIGSYQLPAYEFKFVDLLIGALLGVVSVFVLILFGVVNKFVAALLGKISNPYVVGGVGGALVGLIAFALPLTATSGSSQLATEIQGAAAFGSAFLIAVLLAKMVAIAISMSSGFLGGNVFPIIFIGGTAGLLVNTLFPEIPIALSVGAMLAAVPGAFLNAPVSLILIAAGTVRLGPEALAPIAVAVVIAHLSIALLKTYVVSKKQLNLQTD